MMMLVLVSKCCNIYVISSYSILSGTTHTIANLEELWACTRTQPNILSSCISQKLDDVASYPFCQQNCGVQCLQNLMKEKMKTVTDKEEEIDRIGLRVAMRLVGRKDAPNYTSQDHAGIMEWLTHDSIAEEEKVIYVYLLNIFL